MSRYQSFVEQNPRDDHSHSRDFAQNQASAIDHHQREQFLKDCKSMMKWWAQYNEGIGNYDKSFEFYRMAGDHYSLVRMYCFVGKLKEAADIVIQSGDHAAAFRMAIELEKTRQIKPAIEFYIMAQSYKHAIRLARQNDMPQDVMRLALQAPPSVTLDAAIYFEKKGEMEKAVLLYQKSGRTAKAIDICFQSQLFDPLLEIAENISSELEKQQFNKQESTGTDKTKTETESLDPQILIRCGDFFMEHGEFEKAVMMYVSAKEFNLVLDLCLQKGVNLTEDMAERILPTEKINLSRQRQNEEDPEYKKTRKLLHRLASIAAQQGQYDLAAKKFVQLGDKETAMKVLIKSGNTEKIKFFATMSRTAELYILAANYLQNLDWHNHPETMKSIISFYTRAKAWQQLARFYEACSQVEIDDYRNYDKALDALKEALKYMSKAVNRRNNSGNVGHSVRQNMMNLKNRIYLVDKFIMARSITKSDPEEMINLCDQLLNELENSTEEESVRIGDVYALLIEFYYTQGEMQQAYDQITKMRENGIPLNYYIDPPIVADICNQLGVEMMGMGDEDMYDNSSEGHSSGNGSDVEPFVEEELSDSER